MSSRLRNLAGHHFAIDDGEGFVEDFLRIEIVIAEDDVGELAGGRVNQWLSAV
jgi:hypothetical protein